MKVYMVFASDNDGNRWIDSQWTTREHAEERSAELKASMDACLRLVTKHNAFIVEGSVSDAGLAGQE